MSKFAAGERLVTAISLRPAVRRPAGRSTATVVHAAPDPSPIPSQLANGLGPANTGCPLTVTSMGFDPVHSSSSPVTVSLAGPLGAAGKSSVSTARGYALWAP